MSRTIIGQATLPHAGPGTRQDIAALQSRIDDLVKQGCEVDDANLISKALCLSGSPGSKRSPEELMTTVSNRVWFYNSPKVLTYIITHGSDIISRGASVATFIADAIYDYGFPKDMVEILLAHGWDINAREIG